MIRVVPALLIACLLAAFTAGPTDAAKPAAAAIGLRGPLAPTAAKPLQSPVPRLFAATASPAFDAAPDGDSCRLTCARKYYFCLAGEDADQCPGQWIQCRSACFATPGSSLARP
jgi:hypothetical protein